MPELPEVETVRRQLAPICEGRRLRRVAVLDPRWCAPLAPAELVDAVQGRRIEGLSRRGKYLIWDLSGEVHLIQHLRMTGTILLDPSPEQRHVRVTIELSRRAGMPADLAFVDPRRFGTGQLALGDAALEAFFADRLGLEPIDPRFTTEYLAGVLRGRRTAIKPLLLDQRRLAGVGNIYADEALHGAGIHPLRPARQIRGAQVERLRASLATVLEAGIESRGASIDDFRGVDGVYGSFQDRFRVHLRAGEPCETCGREIVKITVAGRGTYVCERCQPRPRRRR
jgi:formamidopyrimidine-DNA glycosylase